MATQKGLTEIVCDAVKALQDPKGSRLKQIFAYAKEVTQNEELTLGKVKLALKNAIDKEMLKRTYDGRFNLNVQNTDVQNTDAQNGEVQEDKKEDDLLAEACGCPKKRRRRCRPRRKRCRSRRRRKSCRRSCTKMWVPKRRKRCRPKRRRSCKPRRMRRCCTPMWVPKRRRCRQ